MIQALYIFQLTEKEAKKIAASTNELHQHDFQKLIIGIKGRIEHFIDFATTEFEAPFISFVAQEKVHRLIPKLKNGHYKWRGLLFKSESNPETIFQLYSFYHNQANSITQSLFLNLTTIFPKTVTIALSNKRIFMPTTKLMLNPYQKSKK
ncbi:hypothetical protein [Flavobacterium granuli]|uniref:Uncharacterized protein n=1 Tax=Flavobacterium granuli TaxID=280093 RepID=A0A1M5S2V9_9FLAO|nr:hypothetical protein [Flavobacterium granuli]PRZ21189.1 hypothetical protein BC624_10942 [Flavobacterium granuli]SHH32791.1 hypothetical protein SAMN05443373_11142 [Flavobacterium granuli]